MKADLRIPRRDYHQNKTLEVLLLRAPGVARQFFVRMNGSAWPKDGRPVSLTRVLAAWGKALVRVAVAGG